MLYAISAAVSSPFTAPRWPASITHAPDRKATRPWWANSRSRRDAFDLETGALAIVEEATETGGRERPPGGDDTRGTNAGS